MCGSMTILYVSAIATCCISVECEQFVTCARARAPDRLLHDQLLNLSLLRVCIRTTLELERGERVETLYVGMNTVHIG